MAQIVFTDAGTPVAVVPVTDPVFALVAPIDRTTEPAPIYTEVVADLGSPFLPLGAVAVGADVIVGEVC